MVTAQQVATDMVADRKRITPLAVTCEKVSFEICTPDVIAVVAGCQRRFCRTGATTTFARTDQAVTLKVFAYRRYGWIAGPIRMLLFKPDAYLRSTPITESEFC